MNTTQLKSIALPREHGGWGLWLEAVLTGLILQPALSAWWIALAGLSIFLLYQPLQIALRDQLSHDSFPRTVWAWRFAGLYGVGAALSLGGAFLTSRFPFWVPLLIVPVLGAGQLSFALKKETRGLVPELAGGIVFGAFASSMLLSGGWPVGESLSVWFLLALRSVTSILYIRQRLSLERGEGRVSSCVFASHAAGLMVIGLLCGFRYVSWFALAGYSLLCLRATAGLLVKRGKKTRPQSVGVQEIIVGLVYVFFIVAGYKS